MGEVPVQAHEVRVPQAALQLQLPLHLQPQHPGDPGNGPCGDRTHPGTPGNEPRGGRTHPDTREWTLWGRDPRDPPRMNPTGSEPTQTSGTPRNEPCRDRTHPETPRNEPRGAEPTRTPGDPPGMNPGGCGDPMGAVPCPQDCPQAGLTLSPVPAAPRRALGMTFSAYGRPLVTSDTR